LFDLSLVVSEVREPGGPEGLIRRVGLISGGSFAGERLSGIVLAGSDDWQTVRADGALLIDARATLRTDDGALIGMLYAGMRHGPPAVMAALAAGEAIDPASYYFRVTATFTTSSPEHGWLNRLVAVATGDRRATGPYYRFFEVA
jgi:hypothetical protein